MEHRQIVSITAPYRSTETAELKPSKVYFWMPREAMDSASARKFANIILAACDECDALNEKFATK